MKKKKKEEEYYVNQTFILQEYSETMIISVTVREAGQSFSFTI